jgi:hypothetical protein
MQGYLCNTAHQAIQRDERAQHCRKPAQVPQDIRSTEFRAKLYISYYLDAIARLSQEQLGIPGYSG